MATLNTAVAQQQRSAFSPLVLSDRLLTLAEDADRAGLHEAAEHLLELASEVLDEAPHWKH